VAALPYEVQKVNIIFINSCYLLKSMHLFYIIITLPLANAADGAALFLVACDCTFMT